ncbi:hypothetical protein MKW92_034320 [Papaver armeniacum]|nr:hypothetical protein MKW92_034320 [Papaver armeniacum]
MNELSTPSIIITINYSLYKHNDLSSQYFHFNEESRHRYSKYFRLIGILVKKHLVSSSLTILQTQQLLLSRLPLVST